MVAVLSAEESEVLKLQEQLAENSFPQQPQNNHTQRNWDISCAIAQ